MPTAQIRALLTWEPPAFRYGGGGAEVGVPGSRFACRSVLLVEQNARSGLAAAHVGAVLESGVVRLVRPAGELLADPDVARLYLGGHAAAAK